RMLEVCFSAHPNIQYRTGKQAMQTVTITVCIACFYVTVRTVRAATHLYFCLSVLVNHKATCLHSGRHF
ncbi:hypothetical protein DXA34_21200, partial [[Clostridium] symbiosum]